MKALVIDLQDCEYFASEKQTPKMLGLLSKVFRDGDEEMYVQIESPQESSGNTKKRHTVFVKIPQG